MAVDNDRSLAWPCITEVQHVERGDVVLGGPCGDRVLAGQRVGKALFNEVVAVAQRRDAHRLEWQVLTGTRPPLVFTKGSGP